MESQYDIFVKFADHALERKIVDFNYKDKENFINEYKALEKQYFLDGSNERLYTMFKNLWDLWATRVRQGDLIRGLHEGIKQLNYELIEAKKRLQYELIEANKNCASVASGKMEFKPKKKSGRYNDDSD